jgi:phosphoribosylamine-glycine ligase
VNDGKPIVGLELVREAYVFQAGTAEKNGLVSKGGRVLTVTAFGKDLEQAIAAAYSSAVTDRVRRAYPAQRHRSRPGTDARQSDERPTTGLSAYRPQAMVPSFSALRLYRPCRLSQ